MIRLIVCDMDGTLLDDNKNLQAQFWEVYDALQARNIQFAIASGRQYYNLAHRFLSLTNSCIFIAENGALVMHKNKCLQKISLSNNELKNLIFTGRAIPNADILFCGLKSAYIEHDYAPLWEYANKYFKNLQLVNSLDEVKDECLKITICDFNNVRENSYKYFQPLEDRYNLAVSGRFSLDINSINANKGIAVKAIQEKLRISPDETMVFGDHLNDKEMMLSAKYNYAMKNAQPEILQLATYITEYSNNENGVLKTICKHIL